MSVVEQVVDTHCVRDETVVRSHNDCLYKSIRHIYIYLDGSSYQLLALEADSIKPPGCKRADGGWREDGRSERAEWLERPR